MTTLVTTVVIGAPGESWDNRHVVISGLTGPFNELDFEGVNSPSDLVNFCADDMTITYAPEPASLLGLLGGLTALAVWRRRR